MIYKHCNSDRMHVFLNTTNHIQGRQSVICDGGEVGYNLNFTDSLKKESVPAAPRDYHY